MTEKILVIEDDEGMRKVLNIHLHDSGYEADFAKTFNEGLQFFKSADYKIVLCDLKLPDKSGAEIIKILKTENKAVPIIAISGFIDSSMIKDVMDAGAVEYLTKPFSKERLLSALKSILDDR